MSEPGPIPTLGELQQSTPWVWLWCERCQHHSPFACAVAVIRWGAGASSDRLRQRSRCTSCGSKGGNDPTSRLGRQSYRLSAVSHLVTCTVAITPAKRRCETKGVFL